MQSFIKVPAGNSHCAVPTFIKLRARKCECQGTSHRDSTKVSSSRLQRSNGCLPQNYTLGRESGRQFSPFSLGSFPAGIPYKIINKLGYLFSCSWFSQEWLEDSACVLLNQETKGARIKRSSEYLVSCWGRILKWEHSTDFQEDR